MLSLKTASSMQLALEACPHPELKRLLALRLDQLSDGHDDVELGDRLHILIVEADDPMCCVSAEAGFNPLECFIDGTVYGDPDFSGLSCDTVEIFDRWVELAFDFGESVTMLFVERTYPPSPLLQAAYDFAGDEPF